MKILVLGATGFLGKRICKRLTEERIEFVRISQSLGSDLRLREDFEWVFEHIKSITHIFNCAVFNGGIQFGYKYPAEIFYNNILINTYMFQLAHKYGVKRIINPISNCSYPGLPQGRMKNYVEEEWWDGVLDESVMVYGFVRKASWVQSWAYWKQYGLETINLIVPNMYGPGDHFDEVRSHALGALIMKMSAGKKADLPFIDVWGTGNPVREWIYCEDVVEAMMRSLTIDHFPDPVNIGVGYGVSIKKLAEMIKKEVGYEGELVYDTTKPNGAPYKVMDISLCKKIFGWNPQTSLEEGIRLTVEWYKNNAH